MKTWPIRVRLTAWYTAIFAVAAIALAASSFYLVQRSSREAADAGLHARIAGVRGFLADAETSISIEDLREEFGEYAELTQGEALLEVAAADGTLLTQPTARGWTDMVRTLVTADDPAGARATDRSVGGLPFRAMSSRVVSRGHAYVVTVAAPMQSADAALDRFGTRVLLLVPLLLIAAGVTGHWVSGRALAPVDRLTRAVQSITLHRLDERVEVPPADDEVRRLAVTFNDMLARLQHAVSDIVRFTGDAAHELRTPVALVRSTAEVALRRPRSAAEYAQSLCEIVTHSEAMSTLVEDLLMLARVDAGIATTRGDSADVVDLVTRARASLATVAQARQVEVTLHVPQGPLLASGDPGLLLRLVATTLENAITYSFRGGTVTITVGDNVTDTEVTGILIAISDQGIGLSPEEAPRLFERFFRGAKARQHAPDGNGLGLAIAQRIAGACGGSISLQPNSGDHPSGCCARVLLRRAPTSPPL